MDTIKEYLVALKFDADDPSLAKFQRYMDLGEQTVTRHSSGMVKTMFESQFAIVGAFTGISTAAVGMMDKVAMADQGYRLMGLRMMMTTENARKLDMITKSLGADLPTILFDPELHERASLMAADLDKMNDAFALSFGAKGEGNLRGVRNFNFEFGRMEQGAKYLGMHLTAGLFEKLGLGPAGEKLHDWITQFQRDIPQTAEKIEKYLVPVLKTTWGILTDMVDVAKGAGLAFTNIVGLLTGDSSIEDSEPKWEKFAKAIDHVAKALRKMLKALTDAETFVASGASGISALLSGNTDAAGKNFDKAGAAVSPGSAAVLGIGGLWGGSKLLAGARWGAGLLGMGGSAAATTSGVAAGTVAAGETAVAGGAATGGASALAGVLGPLAAVLGGAWVGRKLSMSAADSFEKSDSGKEWKDWKKQNEPEWLREGAHGMSEFFGLLPPEDKAAPGAPSAVGESKQAQPGLSTSRRAGNYASDAEIAKALKSNVATEIAASADKYKVPKSLALAVAYHESRFRQSAVNSQSGATGIMQLMPATAKDLGVDPHDELQNIAGGMSFLSKLTERYHGDQSKVLAAYDWGPGRVKVNGPLPSPDHMPEETREYLPEVLAMQQQFEHLAGGNEQAGRADRFRYPEAPVAPNVKYESNVKVEVAGVYVTHTNADARDIGREVAEQVGERLSQDSRSNQSYFAPAW